MDICKFFLSKSVKVSNHGRYCIITFHFTKINIAASPQALDKRFKYYVTYALSVANTYPIKIQYSYHVLQQFCLNVYHATFRRYTSFSLSHNTQCFQWNKTGLTVQIIIKTIINYFILDFKLYQTCHLYKRNH